VHSGNIEEFVNNVIYANEAGDTNGAGGGICIEESTMSLMNNTFYENQAGVKGGGLCSIQSTVEIVNTIFDSSDAPEGPELWIGNTSDLAVYFTMVTGAETMVFTSPDSTLTWGAGMLQWETAPLFEDPENGDLHLSWRSCCINRGIDAGAPAADIEGHARPLMSMVDMGAYEFSGKHRLEADALSVSASTGGTINFTLASGEDWAFRKYCLLLCVSGTNPGLLLPPKPCGEKLTMRLNLDTVTWGIVFPLLNTISLDNFLGQLDAMGDAVAQFNCPVLPVELVGYNFYFAYTIYNPFDSVSNPIKIQIVE